MHSWTWMCQWGSAGLRSQVSKDRLHSGASKHRLHFGASWCRIQRLDVWPEYGHNYRVLDYLNNGIFEIASLGLSKFRVEAGCVGSSTHWIEISLNHLRNICRVCVSIHVQVAFDFGLGDVRQSPSAWVSVMLTFIIPKPSQVFHWAFPCLWFRVLLLKADVKVRLRLSHSLMLWNVCNYIKGSVRVNSKENFQNS